MHCVITCSLSTFSRSDKVGCEQAYQDYGYPGHVEERICDEENYPGICSFQVTKSENINCRVTQRFMGRHMLKWLPSIQIWAKLMNGRLFQRKN